MSEYESESPVFQIYMKEVSKHTIPTLDEETDLVKKVQAGDNGARDELLERNQRLVVSIAFRYVGKGVALMDLINEGNLGLLRAIEKFRLDRGAKLSTYASIWIKQKITRALFNDSRDVRIPIGVQAIRNQIFRTIRDYVQEFGTRPTDEEIAELLEISVEKVKFCLKQGNRDAYTALDGTYGDESDTLLHEFYEDENSVSPLTVCMLRDEFPELVRELRELFQSVYIAEKNLRNLDIFTKLYGIDHQGITLTLEDVGKMFGMTRERIRQIKENIWKKVRKCFPERTFGEVRLFHLLHRINAMENIAGQSINLPAVWESVIPAQKSTVSTASPKEKYCKTVPMLRRFRSGEIKGIRKDSLLETIIETVSRAYGIDVADLVGNSGNRHFIWPRRVAIAIATKEPISPSVVERRFEIRRAHMSIMVTATHSVLCDGDPGIREDFNFLHASIKALWPLW